jgi:hypothetical protein
MFGILKGASCAMKTSERQEWLGHLCGVCLALRGRAGHLSRLATNYDAALIAALCEAQNPAPPQRYTSHCPLRSHFKTEVTAPDSAAAQYAAAVALVMASTKIQDHVADGETFLRHLPSLAVRLARKWTAKGERLARNLGFGTETIEAQTRRQALVEAETERDFLYYARPTELAVAAAFQHTAMIANAPQNAPILYELGLMFGRIMYLLDSYEDYAADIATKKFNALASCCQENELQQQASRIFQDAYQALKSHFYQLDLARPNLLHKLLIQQLKQRSYKVLELGGCTSCSCWQPTKMRVTPGASSVTADHVGGPLGAMVSFFSRRRRIRDRTGGCDCCETLLCCDCCTECCCCCDWDLCDCENGGCEFCECECCECCECSCCQCCGDEGGCCDCDCG